jgi:hypothetical protein
MFAIYDNLHLFFMELLFALKTNFSMEHYIFLMKEKELLVSIKVKLTSIKSKYL